MPLPPPPHAHDAHTTSTRWKGKARERAARDDGQGAQDGILLDLELIDDSPYQSAYVVPIFLGSASTRFSVQVDTGSSDLWLASTSCSSSLCNQVKNNKYDPTLSARVATPAPIQLRYAEGEVDGPVVWDHVQLGGYSIDNQALIAADNVVDEPLSTSFNGVLGLALPSNSLIAQHIPATDSDAPDGAALPSNLLSITPISTAPRNRFFSLALERPGSDRVRSVLGIGRHPSDLVPDPSKIQYANLVSVNGFGPQWWQAAVHAITVYVHGVKQPISLPTSSSGSGSTSAILDSGVPLIIMDTSLANAIYGAHGINPASDGNYYVPCDKPLNISIELDGREEIFLHPLDLTYFPPSDATSDTCIGAIQTPARFPGLVLTAADMILGVPFLRNTYTVMAYDSPYSNGSFPANSASANKLDYVRPRLGLLNLTDPAVAAAEFHQVRVLKQPLGKTQDPEGAAHSKGLSVGVKVLFGLLGLFGLCFVLFGARWAYMRRKYARQRAAAGVEKNGLGAYTLTPMKPPGDEADGDGDGDGRYPSEDELRKERFDAYKRRTAHAHMGSMYTDDTASTRVEEFGEVKFMDADEFGAVGSPGAALHTPHSPYTPLSLAHAPERPLTDYFDTWGSRDRDSTLVNGLRPLSMPTSAGMHDAATLARMDSNGYDAAMLLSPPPRTARRDSSSPRSVHHRTLSGGPGADMPLLAHGHARGDSNPQVGPPSPGLGLGLGMGHARQDEEDIAELGMSPPATPSSMAGVGTAGRSRRVSGMTPSPLASPWGEDPPPPGEPHSHRRAGSGGSARSGRPGHGRTPSAGSAGSAHTLAVPEPAVVSAPTPVQSPTRDASRVSVFGHEPPS